MFEGSLESFIKQKKISKQILICLNFLLIWGSMDKYKMTKLQVTLDRSELEI